MISIKKRMPFEVFFLNILATKMYYHGSTRTSPDIIYVYDVHEIILKYSRVRFIIL